MAHAAEAPRKKEKGRTNPEVDPSGCEGYPRAPARNLANSPQIGYGPANSDNKVWFIFITTLSIYGEEFAQLTSIPAYLEHGLVCIRVLTTVAI